MATNDGNKKENHANGRDWWQQTRKPCKWQRLVALTKMILQMAANDGNKKENHANGRDWWQ